MLESISKIQEIALTHGHAVIVTFGGNNCCTLILIPNAISLVPLVPTDNRVHVTPCILKDDLQKMAKKIAKNPRHKVAPWRYEITDEGALDYIARELKPHPKNDVELRWRQKEFIPIFSEIWSAAHNV